MSGVEVSYTDRNALLREAAESTWIVAGLLGVDEPRFDPSDGSGTVEAALCHQLGDATVLRVDHPDGQPTRVRMWRGATSSHELCWGRRADGPIVIADHFRNVICRLPIEQRRPSEAVTIDHFLFRHARGRDTYSAAVRRVGHGESVDLDVRSGDVAVEIFDRLVSRLDPRPIEQYTADLDGALQREMDRLRTVPGAVTMFSGGMDSTLLQSYLGNDVPALHMSIDADDFEFGGAFMAASASALGIRPERAVVPAEGFLRHVEDAIDARGVPPHFPQWVTLGPAFARPHQVFIIGERAGMFAREGGRIPYTARRLAWMPGHLLHPLLRAVSTVPRPHRLRLLATQAPWLDNDPLSPDGWGVQMPQAYGDRPWAERVFGESPVRARYQARLDYIRDHVELLPSTADRYSRHIEIGGWQDFYNENSSQFLSFALACGKSVTDPFTARGVIDATLAVPATERHQDGARSKYIIERLLRERVPAYPASAVKDPIKVPFVEYYRSGPLMHVWDHYDIPEFFVGADRTRLLERPGLPVWNALTWAIWQDRIVQNASLRPLPSSIDRSWEVHPDRVSA